MKDLSTITFEDFQACLGQAFLIASENEDNLEFELIEVKAIGDFNRKTDTRQAFSALFRGPRELPLVQSLYRIENADLGALQLFLVPLGPDETGILYDATFN